MGYKNDVIKGVSWMGLLRFATRFVSFIKTVVLARILVPSQFGAYGVALLLLGFLEVMTETGVNVILIQEDEVDKHVNSAWLVSILRGILISLVIFCASPFVSQFFHSKESLILLYMIGTVPFLRGFINPSIVKFQKLLKFNLEFIYRFSILFIDTAVALIATIVIRQPIGIVMGLIAGVIVEVILSYILVKPIPVIKIEKSYLSKLFHRGKWVTASGVFNYLFHNADNIVVGRMLGTGSLGIYQIAYTLSILPITEIADLFSKVTFPVFTKISGDGKRLKAAFFKTMLVIALLSLPFGILLVFFPAQIVSLVLGNKWLAAVSILPILGVFGVIRAISGSSSTLFLAVGKQEYVTVVTLVSILGLIIPIIPLVIRFNILGAAYAALIGSLLAVPFMAYYTYKVFNDLDEKS